MRGRSTLRRVVGGLLGVVVGGLTLAVATRWVDLVTPETTAVQALVPVWGLALVLVVAFAGALRHRGVALAGVLPALVVLVVFGASLRSQTVATSPADPTAVTVMSSNLEYGQADAGQVVAAVKDHGVAVLVLAEVTPEALTRLDARGLTTLLPYAAGTAEEGASGTVIRSRYPLTAIGSDEQPHGPQLGFRSPLARVERPGAPFLVKGVHTLPPTAWPQWWVDDLASLAALQDGEPTSVPLVLAGDFNASADHPAYRRMADGLTDVNRAAGGGWIRTWPHGWPVPAFVQLDHVLVRGFDTVAAGTVVLDGTDHAAVWGTVR
ncbi:MAG: endonuclease/exonuclease/phosphatase family protein [Lapillicoccus sp.]